MPNIVLKQAKPIPLSDQVEDESDDDPNNPSTPVVQDQSEAQEEESDDPNANKLPPDSPKQNVQKRLASSHGNSFQLRVIGASNSSNEQSKQNLNKKTQDPFFRQPIIAHTEELKTSFQQPKVEEKKTLWEGPTDDEDPNMAALQHKNSNENCPIQAVLRYELRPPKPSFIKLLE